MRFLAIMSQTLVAAIGETSSDQDHEREVAFQARPQNSVFFPAQLRVNCGSDLPITMARQNQMNE